MGNHLILDFVGVTSINLDDKEEVHKFLKESLDKANLKILN